MATYSIVRRGSAQAGKIRALDVAALDPDVANEQPGSQEALVTAVLTAASGELKLIQWEFSAFGEPIRKDFSPTVGGPLASKDMSACSYEVNNGLVIATIGEIENYLYFVDAQILEYTTGPKPYDSQSNTQKFGAVTDVAVAYVGQMAVTAVRGAESGKLRVITFRELYPSWHFERRGKANAGAVSDLDVAGGWSNPIEDPEYPRRFVTAVRDGDGRLRVIAWRVSIEGAIVRGGHFVGGKVSEVTLVHNKYADQNTFHTAARDAAGNLRLMTWYVAQDTTAAVTPSGPFAEHVTNDPFSSIAMAFSEDWLGANNVTAGRDAAGNLKVILWDWSLEGDIKAKDPGFKYVWKRLAHASAGAISDVVVAPVRTLTGQTNFFVTAVRTATNYLKVILWEVVRTE